MDDQRATLLRLTRRRLTLTGVLANGVGAFVVASFLLFISPVGLAAGTSEEIRERSVPAFLAFMAITLPLGRWLVAMRPFRPIAEWLLGGGPPSDEVRARVLRYATGWAIGSFYIWTVGALTFAALNVDIDTVAAIALLIGTLLGAATACSLQYLLVERIIRPVTALALADGLPRRTGVPGVAYRMSMTWTLATGVPLLGIAALATLFLTGTRAHADRLIVAELFLAVLALSVGLAAMLVATQSVAEPLTTIRRALAAVQDGALETRVPIDDGSEVGLLQAGFNRMTAGLGERERLRHAFGAFVDPSLTERVLREGTDLAGEEIEVSLLMLDVRGFTSFAEGAGAREVVATLNAIYGDVVPVVLAHGGHANKFIGDGLLAVFGAPDRLADHAQRAVAAGLQIVELVKANYLLRVGVGINSGPVVAGTIGGGGRVEFTVIGDPVNTAARVEAATRVTGDDLLITGRTRQLLGGDTCEWVERPPMPMKGKSETVRLYAPAPSLTRA